VSIGTLTLDTDLYDIYALNFESNTIYVGGTDIFYKLDKDFDQDSIPTRLSLIVNSTVDQKYTFECPYKIHTVQSTRNNKDVKFYGFNGLIACYPSKCGQCFIRSTDNLEKPLPYSYHDIELYGFLNANMVNWNLLNSPCADEVRETNIFSNVLKP